MGMGDMVDFIFLACGAYLVGTSVMAKAQGNIAANVMLGKNVTESDIKDKVGFIDFMYKRLLLSGVMIIIGSIIHLINDYYVSSVALTLVGIVLILSALVIYTRSYFDAQKRYIPHKAARFNQDKDIRKSKRK